MTDVEFQKLAAEIIAVGVEHFDRRVGGITGHDLVAIQEAAARMKNKLAIATSEREAFHD